MPVKAKESQMLAEQLGGSEKNRLSAELNPRITLEFTEPLDVDRLHPAAAACKETSEEGVQRRAAR